MFEIYENLWIFLFIVKEIQKVQKKRSEYTGGEKKVAIYELTRDRPIQPTPLKF